MIETLKRILKPESSQPDTDYRKISYSQEGEDLILSTYFSEKKNGFYVEIGAHHPFRFSNTYMFYKRGWHGLTIDPLPGVKELFARHRPKDIFLNIGVGPLKSVLPYYEFEESAHNTFSEEQYKNIAAKGIKLINTVDVPVLPLAEVLEKHLPANQLIDFFSVDAEGLDLSILQSNDWEKYRPQMIVVEESFGPVEKILELPLYRYLVSQSYMLLAKSYKSLFFKNIK